MYKTTGIIDNSFYEEIKYHVYPKNRRGLLKFCITILVLYYLLSVFLIRDLVCACVSVFGISLYTFAFFYTVKKYTKINIKRIQESYHTDSMDMSTEFTEDAMLISSSVCQDPTQIYYQDISRVVLTSKHYLIFTKAEQLICVFADQLREKDRLGLIGFLKEKIPKIKVYKEKTRKMYFVGAGLILLYVSFVVFLFGYFKKPEASIDVNQNIHTDVSDIDLLEEAAANKIIETVQPETTEITYQIKNPSWEYYCSDVVEEVENIPLKLEQVYEVENDITDLDVWLASNEFTVSRFPYSDENYFYTFTGAHFYEATGLMISEFSGENHIYSIDMNEFSMTPDKIYEENDPFTDDRGYVNFAKVKDNILYVSTGHRGYTVNNPSTGYVTAIDLENGEILWKSAPQVSNAYNFEIIGDVIICGYGFTDEDDFLYILNRANGQIMEQIPLKSMAEYIVAKDSMLYVRAYNRNYEFHIKNFSLSESVNLESSTHNDMDSWGIAFTAENITPSGLTIVCSQTGVDVDGELFATSYFNLSKYDNNEWIEVEYILPESEITWTGEALRVVRNDVVKWDVNWESIYGNLPAGLYRVNQDVVNSEWGRHNTVTYHIDFNVK